jgi:hypothetical protein
MTDRPVDDSGMPEEIDFHEGTRGLHHIPASAKVLMPVSIERGAWEYFSGKAALAVSITPVATNPASKR